MTSPPVALSNSAMRAPEGCAAMSDASGNLMFYTNGMTVWNRQHLVMANGTGLLGDTTTTQSSIIFREPGSPGIYYIFTLNDYYYGGGELYYSKVDMSLAAGMGSVTIKNAIVSTSNTEQMTAVKHCNGSDVWVITHENNSNQFRVSLVTSLGVSSPTAISIGSSYGSNGATLGFLKASPNGNKLALAPRGYFFELYDFDTSTGVISNSLTLSMYDISYGCEFSADGTKFYGAADNIYQWDLCAGSSTAIVNSQYILTQTLYGWLGMQLAKNGKIYFATSTPTVLGEIANPEIYGPGCNLNLNALTIAPGTNFCSLPNFMASYFLYHPVPAPFTYTMNPTNCYQGNFTAPPVPVTATGCAVSYSFSSMQWMFGDPASGPANTSTLTNPSHVFSSPGTYTTQLIFYYTCGGGSDTLRQTLVIDAPNLTILTTSITCASLGSATVLATGGIPPYTYTWMPGVQTSSVATGLAPGSYSIIVDSNNGTCVFTSTTNFSSLIPLTGTLTVTPTLSCNGYSTGIGGYSNLSGGSGNEFYLWINGSTTNTLSGPTTLSAGNWSVTVTDALTGCAINDVFTITQPPAFTLNVVASSPTACAGTGIVLTGTNSGGTPGYTYSWTGGPASTIFTVSEAPGVFNYSLNSLDANNCTVSEVISVNFLPNPTLTVADASICPMQTGTLTAFGAGSYFWNGSVAGNTFTDNPLSTTQYSVIGSTAGCTTAATASIVVNPIPTPTLAMSVQLCVGDPLLLNGGGGVFYNWSGPSGFTSSLQNPSLAVAGLTNAGTYSLVVTAANSCTALATSELTVNPTPTLAVSGSTVCTTQTLTLSANSSPGSAYLWSGPLSFTSSQQTNFIADPALSQSGTFTVVVTGTNGCITTGTAGGLVVSVPDLGFSLSSGSFCAQALNGSPNTITLTANGAVTYTVSTPNHINNPNPGGPASPLNLIPPFQPSGPATATLQGSNGVCTVSTSVVFTIIPNPTVSILSNTPVICAGESFTYTNYGANSYTWSAANPGNTIYTTGDVAVSSPSISSVFSVVGGSLGCYSAQQTSTLTVNPLPVFMVQNATICPNTSAILSANGSASSYSWSPPIGLSAVSGVTVSAGPQLTQNYIVTAFLNNCTANMPVTVSVMPLPSPSLAVSKNEVCLYETIKLEGLGGSFYDWYLPGGVSLHGQNVSYIINNINQSGNYTLTVTDQNGCKNSIATSVLVKKLPGGSVLGNKEGCAPFCTDLRFQSNGSISGNWLINQQSFSGTSISYCFNTPGTYSVNGNLIDAQSTCSNVIDFVVNVHPKPIADFEYYPDRPIESMDEVLFNNVSSGQKINNWNWYFINNGGYRANSENTSYLFSTSGNHPVAMVVSNVWGCKDTLVRVVKVEPFFNVYVPNTFTPNGDNLNDIFMPVGSGVASYQLMIFDRWGEKVFESNSFANGWSGDYKGEPAKTDVYTWKISVVNGTGSTKLMNGHVSLIR